MTRWYKAVSGKADGPYTAEEIREALDTGKIRPLDLVFCEGDVSWRLVSEVPEFREVFSALPTSASEEDFAWVILRKKGSGYVQTGPLSATQVRERIGTGEIEYSHYAWRAGYKRWTRIGNIPEFDRRAKDRDGDPVNQIVPLPRPVEPTGGESTEEILSNVMRMSRAQAQPVADAAPDEADGMDLVEFRPLTLPPLVQAAPAEASVTAAAAFGEEAASDGANDLPTPATQKPPLRRGARLAFAGAMSFLVIVVALYAIDHQGRSNGDVSRATNSSVAGAQAADAAEAREIASVPAAGDAAPSAAVPTGESAGAASQVNSAPAGAAQDPAFTPEATAEAWGTAASDDPNLAAPSTGTSPESIAAAPATTGESAPSQSAQAKPNALAKATGTVLEIVPLKLESQPQIVFQTNAPVGEAIKLTIKSAEGEGASYSRTVTLARKPGEIPTVDLAAWGLKPGAYEVEARVGETQAEQKFVIGRREPVAEAKPKDERESLAVASRRLTDLTTSLRSSGLKLVRDPKKWTDFYAAWEKQVNESAGAIEGLKAPGAQELQLAVNHLLDQARQLNESFEQKRTVAGSQTETLVKLEQEFKRLSEKLAIQAK
jgi:hypothetical protein